MSAPATPAALVASRVASVNRGAEKAESLARVHQWRHDQTGGEADLALAMYYAGLAHGRRGAVHELTGRGR